MAFGNLTNSSTNATSGLTFADGLNVASLSATGITTIGGGSVTSTGAQSYAGVLLTADTTINGKSAGNVTFNTTVDSGTGGPFALTVESDAIISFKTVGSTSPLTSLDATQFAGTTGAINLGGNITTSGAAGQTFDLPVTLTAAAVLDAGTANPIGFTNTVDGAFNLTLKTNGTARRFRQSQWAPAPR